MEFLFKLLLYISSYIPVVILIYLNNMNDLSFKSFNEVLNLNIAFWIIILLISIFSGLTLWRFIYLISSIQDNNVESININSINIKPNDGETLSYFITYLIPILTLDIDNGASILMNLILVAIVGLYFVRNNFLHFNILLLVLNYKIYTDDSERIYISRNDIFSMKVRGMKAYEYNNSNIYFIK